MHGPPQHAPLARRFAAWLIDGTLIFGVFALLCGFGYARIADHLRAQATQAVTVDVWAVVSSGGDVAGVARESGGDLWGGTVSIVIQGFVLLVLAQLAYQFIALAWRGRTLGKALLGVQVRTTADARLGAARAARRALVTTLSESGLYAVACVLLVLGEFFLAFACWLLAVTVFLVNALPMFTGRARRSLGDRAGGTVVVRTQVLRDAMRAAGQLAPGRHGNQPAALPGPQPYPQHQSYMPGQQAPQPPALPQAQPYAQHQPYMPGQHPPQAQPYAHGFPPPQPGPNER